MAYTGNPSTNTSDAIRLLIGDVSTSTGSEIFADGEITYFSSAAPNAYLAAALAIESLSGTTRYDRLSAVARKKVGDLEIEYGSREGGDKDLMVKARRLRLQGVRRVKPFAGGISDSAKDSARQDTDWEQGPFKVRLHDYTERTDT